MAPASASAAARFAKFIINSTLHRGDGFSMFFYYTPFSTARQVKKK